MTPPTVPPPGPLHLPFISIQLTRCYNEASTRYSQESLGYHGHQDSGIPPSMGMRLNWRDHWVRQRFPVIPFPKPYRESAADDTDLIKMLLTAIPVIKQSWAVNDECCCVLISSFTSCLHGIEAKCYSIACQQKLFQKNDIYPRRGHLNGPLARRAAGCTGTCFIMKFSMVTTSKKGTKSMTDTRIEEPTLLRKESGWKQMFFNGLASPHLHQD